MKAPKAATAGITGADALRRGAPEKFIAQGRGGFKAARAGKAAEASGPLVARAVVTVLNNYKIQCIMHC